MHLFKALFAKELDLHSIKIYESCEKTNLDKIFYHLAPS